MWITCEGWYHSDLEFSFWKLLLLIVSVFKGVDFLETPIHPPPLGGILCPFIIKSKTFKTCALNIPILLNIAQLHEAVQMIAWAHPQNSNHHANPLKHMNAKVFLGVLYSKK